MGLNANMIMVFGFSFLVVSGFAAPARTVLAMKNNDFSTSSSFPEDDDEQNSLWGDEGEEFDFGGDVWLKEPPLPSRPTWEETDRSSPLLDDVSDNKVIDDNFIGEEIDDDDDVPQNQNDSQQDFLLLPVHDENEKRDRDDQPKVRHTGHSPLSSPAFVVNEVFDDEDDDNDDDDDDVMENYGLVPYSENDATDDEMDDGKEDVFGDESEAESKRLFEDKVFLF